MFRLNINSRLVVSLGMPILLTKRGDGNTRIEVSPPHDHQGGQPPGNLILTPADWQELRDLTPEARALRELVVGIDTFLNQPDFSGVAPELVSAIQEAHVLVKRMGGAS